MLTTSASFEDGALVSVFFGETFLVRATFVLVVLDVRGFAGVVRFTAVLVLCLFAACFAGVEGLAVFLAVVFLVAALRVVVVAVFEEARDGFVFVWVRGVAFGVVDLGERFGLVVLAAFVAFWVLRVVRDFDAVVRRCVVVFFVVALREEVEDGCLFDLVADFAADLTVRGLATGLAVVVLAVVFLARVVDALRVVEATFGDCLADFLAVVALFLLVAEGLRVDAFRAVVVAFVFVVFVVDGVDFFRVEDVLVVLVDAVFRFVVVAFLAAILTLPAK